jgi:hypothetical protein
MKNIALLLPLLIFGILFGLLLNGNIRFGHGFGDVFYYSFIILGLILSLINYFILKMKKIIYAYFTVCIFIIYAVLIFMKMTVWRGPEYLWNGDVIIF